MSQISRWFQFPADFFLRREDARIYAVVRMAFAAVCLLNLILLWPDRLAFFSDVGLVDQTAAASQASPAYLSIFALAESGTAVTTVMLVTALALVMLMAGIYPRLAALWVLVWHVSYLARVPLALTGWDDLMRSFSFLILISPMGKSWTLSAWWSGFSGSGPEEVSRHGLVLMRLQVFVVYWQAVLARLRHPDPYWANGEFLTYFMLSHHARWPGRWVLEYESLFILGTYAVQLAEVSIPVLLSVKKTRRWGFLLGAALHAGIAVAGRDLVLFCLVMMVTYLAFLRKEDVDALGRWMGRWAASLKRPMKAPAA